LKAGGYLISKLYLSGKAILSIDAVEDSEVLLFPVLTMKNY
jgi:hypothetical protein